MKEGWGRLSLSLENSFNFFEKTGTANKKEEYEKISNFSVAHPGRIGRYVREQVKSEQSG